MLVSGALFVSSNPICVTVMGACLHNHMAEFFEPYHCKYSTLEAIMRFCICVEK